MQDNETKTDGLRPLAAFLGSAAQETPDGPSSSAELTRAPYDLGEVPTSEDEYHCATCRDGHWIRHDLPINHPDFGKATPCPDCTNRPRPRGVPDKLSSATFATFDLSLNRGMKPAMDACKAVAKGTRWTCTIQGPPGIGKSHLAVAALDMSVTAGHFWEVGDLLRRMQAECFGDAGPHTSQSEVLDRWQNYEPVLVLDDIGAEKWTDWTAQTLYTILNARYQRRLPTIITSNVPDALDERLLSRYAEGLVVCQGQDVRRVRR